MILHRVQINQLSTRPRRTKTFLESFPWNSKWNWVITNCRCMDIGLAILYIKIHLQVCKRQKQVGNPTDAYFPCFSKMVLDIHQTCLINYQVSYLPFSLKPSCPIPKSLTLPHYWGVMVDLKLRPTFAIIMLLLVKTKSEKMAAKDPIHSTMSSVKTLIYLKVRRISD